MESLAKGGGARTRVSLSRKGKTADVLTPKTTCQTRFSVRDGNENDFSLRIGLPNVLF